MSIKKIADILLYSLIFLNLFFFTAILTYQYTIKGEVVAVPELTGKTFEDAKKDLGRRRLSLVQSGVQLHEKYEQGLIILQDPPPKTKLGFNQVVKVVLSAGKEKVTVPRLINRSFQPIDSTLAEAGLKKGKISHVHTPKYSAGKIIAQNPPSGREVGKGHRINLLVSEGTAEDKYLMPDLIGKRARAVIRQLKDAGFRVADTRYVFYPGIDSDLIIKQNPTQGYPVQKRSPIALEVSK